MTTFIIPDNYVVSMEYQRDRVRIFVNDMNIVSRVPMIGWYDMYDMDKFIYSYIVYYLYPFKNR